MTRNPRAGLTLVEVLVALVVFAVIGIAAFAMLDQTLRSDRLAGARLDRLHQVQRLQQIVSLDTLQAVPNTWRVEPDGVSFLRRGRMDQGADGLTVAYRLSADVFVREIAPLGGDPVRQTLLGGVTAVAWRYHAKDGGDWQSAVSDTGTDGVELVLQGSDAQSLRLVFALPMDIVDSPQE